MILEESQEGRQIQQSHLLDVDNDDGTNSAIVWASERGFVDSVKTLVAGMVDVDGVLIDKKGYMGATAVSRAARHGHAEILDVLLAAGANPNIANNKIQYPLHIAAFHNHMDAVNVLLKWNADTNVLDRKGRTPAEDTDGNKEIRDAILSARRLARHSSARSAKRDQASTSTYAVVPDEPNAEILLRERIKELLSLYSVSTLTAKQPQTTGDATEVFQSVLNVLASSFKFPDSTSAHIIMRNDISFPHKTSRELAASCPLSSMTVVAMSTVAPATISAAIKCEDVVLGTIEMRSHAPMPGSPAGSTTGRHGRHSHRHHSTVLLNDVASKLSDYLTRAAQTDKLLERQKVLACLHRTTQYSIGEGEHGMRQFLTSIIKQIKESMQFPTICDIQIRLLCSGKGKEIVVSTPLFDNKKWTLQTNIALPGTNVHNPVITVNYDDKGMKMTQSKSKTTASMMSDLKAATERCLAVGE